MNQRHRGEDSRTALKSQYPWLMITPLLRRKQKLTSQQKEIADEALADWENEGGSVVYAVERRGIVNRTASHKKARFQTPF